MDFSLTMVYEPYAKSRGPLFVACLAAKKFGNPATNVNISDAVLRIFPDLGSDVLQSYCEKAENWYWEQKKK